MKTASLQPFESTLPADHRHAAHCASPDSHFRWCVNFKVNRPRALQQVKISLGRLVQSS